MYRIIIMSVVILNLAFLPPCSAMEAIQGAGVVQKNKPAKTERTPSSSAKVQSETVKKEVANVVVDRIEGNIIYSTDGQQIGITGGTKVIDNSRRGSKMKIAELVYENGSLVQVILK